MRLLLLLGLYVVSASAIAQSLTPGVGSPRAYITVFASFRCTYCARTVPVIAELERRYPGQIAVQYRHFPLGLEESDVLPHEAALAAAAQGRFLDMYHGIYAAQGQVVGRSDLERVAAALHLDMTQFRRDLERHVWRARIDDDVEHAKSLGVKATPTFFVQGFKLEGMQSVDTLAPLIDHALKTPAAAGNATAEHR